MNMFNDSVTNYFGNFTNDLPYDQTLEYVPSKVKQDLVMNMLPEKIVELDYVFGLNHFSENVKLTVKE